MSSQNAFQIAASRAHAAYGNEAWSKLGVTERSSAIYRELRQLDADSALSSVPPRPNAEGFVLPEAMSLQVAPRESLMPNRPISGSAVTKNAKRLPSALPTGARPNCGAKIPSTPQPIGKCSTLYRVVVRARKSCAKTYGWAIVRDDNEVTVRRSDESYKCMEQAYKRGMVALAEFQDGQLVTPSRSVRRGATSGPNSACDQPDHRPGYARARTRSDDLAGRRDHTLLLVAVQTGLGLYELIGLDRAPSTSALAHMCRVSTKAEGTDHAAD